MHNLVNKKLLLLIISILILSVTVVTLLFFIKFNNTKSIQVASTNKSNNQNTIIKTLIPDVTNENTQFTTSDTSKKIEKFSISTTNKLSDYNLYYCLKFDNTINEIHNSDYILFNDLNLLIEENCTILFKYESNGNYSNNAYEIKVSNIEASKTETSKTEKVDKKTLEKEKVNKEEKKQSTAPYFIRVNYKANVVNIYSKDKDGNYTVPYKSMVCSCGTYTPKSGTYKISSKYVWLPLINNVYGHYSTRIVNKILFHSVPYTSASNDALEYWEYDKLGQTASAGCIRLTVKDAKWIYSNCPSGTMVEFYADSNPGPLGKPSAQKISSNEECRNWDPTDTKEGNPWHTYIPNEENIANNTLNNNSVSNNTIIQNSTIENNISNSNNNTQNNSNVTNTATSNNNTQNNSSVTNTATSNNNTQNNSSVTNTATSNNNTQNNSSVTNTATSNNNTQNNSSVTNTATSNNNTQNNSSITNSATSNNNTQNNSSTNANSDNSINSIAQN